MDYTSESCRKAFLVLRRSLQRNVEKAEFDKKEDVAIDNYNDVCIKAVNNDPIAQDYLAYLFKKGLYNVLPINWEKYMQWQVLAGANGNQFSLDKLSLFLSYALNEISYVEDFEYIANRNDLNEKNYLYVVGRLLCDAIADELHLSPEKLMKDPIEHKEFSAPTMRVFDKARNFSIPKIIKFLRS